METVTRRDECPKCKTELHVCLNCSFFDEKKAYGCKEERADPPRDKERANFCEYFKFREENDGMSKKEAEKMWQEILKRKKP